MSVDSTVRELIKSTLIKLDELTGGKVKHTQEAEDLLFMITSHETHNGRLGRRQIVDGKPVGAARGITQVEKITFDDLWNRYLPTRQPAIQEAIREMIGYEPNIDSLVTDDQLAILMARVKLYTIPEALPSYDSYVKELSDYASEYYNAGGAGSSEDYLTDFKRFI